jgi:hypothetical protein
VCTQQTALRQTMHATPLRENSDFLAQEGLLQIDPQ